MTDQEIQEKLNEVMWHHGPNCDQFPGSFAVALAAYGLKPEQVTEGMVKVANVMSRERLYANHKRHNATPGVPFRVVVVGSSDPELREWGYSACTNAPEEPQEVRKPIKRVSRVQEEPVRVDTQKVRTLDKASQEWLESTQPPQRESYHVPEVEAHSYEEFQERRAKGITLLSPEPMPLTPAKRALARLREKNARADGKR
jgi:hypothetical protein